MSTVTDNPQPNIDETQSFDDSNTITYKVAKYASEPFLYLSLRTEHDCVLNATASVMQKLRARNTGS